MATVILTNTWQRTRTLNPLSEGTDFDIDYACKIHWLQLAYHSQAGGGVRLIKVSILTASGTELWVGTAGGDQQPNKDFLYNFAPYAIRNDAAIEDQFDIPMPEVSIPTKTAAGSSVIRVEDLNDADSADTYSWIAEFSDL